MTITPLAQQLRQCSASLDPTSGALLLRHPDLQGLPTLIVKGPGFTLEFIDDQLLCMDLHDYGALALLECHSGVSTSRLKP